jgi:hypothetical protein
MAGTAHSDTISAAIHALSQSPIRPYVNSYLAKQAILLSSAEHLDGSARPPISLFASSARSQIRVATMAVTLVYFRRLRSRMRCPVRTTPFGAHGLLLTTLVLSDKYLNDDTPRNKWWARHTTVQNYDRLGLSTAKINAMERCLLSLLGWNLRVDAEQLLSETERLQRAISDKISKPHLTSRAQNLYARGAQPCLVTTRNTYAVKSAVFREQRAECSICLARFTGLIMPPPPCDHESCETTWRGSIDICSICKMHIGSNGDICRATYW